MSTLYYTHIIITMVIIHVATSLVLLSDLPTPSFVIDIDSLNKRYTSTLQPISVDVVAPSIRCPDNNLVLHSSINKDICIYCDFKVEEMVPSIGYIHSSIIRAREDKNEDDTSTYLAEIDLDHKLCDDAQLVLGLNNHHVGGYYWARSAGVGKRYISTFLPMLCVCLCCHSLTINLFDQALRWRHQVLHSEEDHCLGKTRGVQ